MEKVKLCNLRVSGKRINIYFGFKFYQTKTNNINNNRLESDEDPLELEAN